MTLKDIETNIEFNVWITPQECEMNVDKVLSVLNLSLTNGYHQFIQNKELKTFILRDKSDGKDLNFYLRKGLTNLCEVRQVAKDGSALLKINFFNGDVKEMGKIEVGIDEKIEAASKKQGIKFRNTKELTQSLVYKCSLDVYMGKEKETYFLMLMGEAAKNDFSNDDIQAFSVVGDTIKVPVAKRDIDKSKTIFFASKLISNKTKNKEGALHLSKGTLVFLDYTKAGEIQSLVRGAMSKLLDEEQSYLKKWDEYGEMEGEALLAKARRFGILRYDSKASLGEKIELYFDENISDRLDLNDTVEITSSIPIYLKNSEFTWKEFIDTLDNANASDASKNDIKKESSLAESNNKEELIDDAINEEIDDIQEDKEVQEDDKKKVISAKITKIDSTSITIASIDDNQISLNALNGKFLIYSILGEQVQVERREQARSKVLEGRSANPQLGLIIEENGVLPNIARKSNMSPLSPFVREKIFNHDPTPVQIKAIEIALNTPDIALIQGPPGTGKTTIITAIIERLNQEHDKSKSIRGQILVTGFQHDAVENIIARLSVNNLPTVKYGKSATHSRSQVKQQNKLMVDTVKEHIKSQNPQIHELKEQEELSRLFVLYVNSPSSNNAKALLRSILNSLSHIITQKQKESVVQLLGSLDGIQDDFIDSEKSISTIKKLRIFKESFYDDGKERAVELYNVFEDVLTENEKKVLKKSILWKENRELDFLQQLKEIKIRLLDKYLPAPQYKMEKPREDILQIIAEMNIQVQSNQEMKNKKDRILADFLYELENNPTSIESAIEDYNYVFSATTQQSEGKDIRIAKKKSRDEFLEYDTVIVDEAARVSPRDLLIPMTQARKRIILVGDHRQLPHIVDEEIIRKLEEELNTEEKEENDYIKKSMFEYLFNRLKKLEANDGIQRTITLDAQYRMHSLLGDFISDNFYKKHDKREAFLSPSPEDFSQNLSKIKNKQAIWLNVPNSEGKEKRDKNHSLYRAAEAEAIAKQLKEWIDSEEGKDLTFGIISFYRAQVNSVFDALEPYGITKNREIVDEYKFLNNTSEERLRIGTVDSFQGMEFDVTFLSMVRTSNSKDRKDSKKHHKEKFEKDDIVFTDEELENKVCSSLFGHLMSENRLCVSLSRQKKVLVVVGDGDLVHTELAIKSIPALSKFYTLCDDKGEILNENH